MRGKMGTEISYNIPRRSRYISSINIKRDFEYPYFTLSEVIRVVGESREARDVIEGTLMGSS